MGTLGRTDGGERVMSDGGSGFRVHGFGGGRRSFAALAAAIAVFCAMLAAASPVGAQGGDIVSPSDDVRLNQIQVIGSHNSYHIQPKSPLRGILRFAATIADLGEDPADLDYSHSPLPTQFGTEQIRQIELDVFADPAGGLYQRPSVPKFICESPDFLALFSLPNCVTPKMPGFPTTGGPEMALPGFKTLHIQDIDFETTCTTFVACLAQVKAWSDANPSHVPIMILVEAKQGAVIDAADIPIAGLTFTEAPAIGPAELDALDAEILSVMGTAKLIRPDDVRGGAATLEEAVVTTGWPTLGESRGKVLFMMDNAGQLRTDYLAGHPTLENRVMFTNSTPGQPDAAFVQRNEPRGADTAEIQALVEAGYVVRTRADTPNAEARSGDTTRRDAALASGAQWVSSDYFVPGRAAPLGSDYVATLPGGGPARCNPVNAPASCVSSELEATTVGYGPRPPAPAATTDAAPVVVADRAAPVVQVPVAAPSEGAELQGRSFLPVGELLSGAAGRLAASALLA